VFNCEGEKIGEKRTRDWARLSVVFAKVSADVGRIEHGLTRHIGNEVFQNVCDLSL
jgi:hypothetical protein